jgi:hypothetical protein
MLTVNNICSFVIVKGENNIMNSKKFRYFANRWAKMLQGNQTWEKYSQILREGKRFKIPVIVYIWCAINDSFYSIYHYVSSEWLTQSVTFFAYFDPVFLYLPGL